MWTDPGPFSLVSRGARDIPGQRQGPQLRALGIPNVGSTRLRLLRGAKTGDGMMGEAPPEVSQEGLAGLTRGASRALVARPAPPDSVSASSLLSVPASAVWSSSPHLLAGDRWSRAAPQR